MSTLPRLTLCILTFFVAFRPFSQTGPGGVEQTNGSSNLEWWVKADAEAYIDAGIRLTSDPFVVTQWNDQSGYGRNISQSGSARPRFYENVLNGQPVVRFDVASQDYFGPLTIDAFQNNYSIFIVGYTSGDEQTMLGVGFPSTQGIGIEGTASNSLEFLHQNVGANTLQAGTSRSTTTSQILSFTRGTPAGGDQQFWINGTDNQSMTGSESNFSSSGSLVLGRNAPGTASNYMNGDIAEVIIYSKEVNAAERIIVENYLAAKYGLTLGSNDVFNEDDNGNGDYDFEVAGIGRVDASNIHDDAQGTGRVRVSSPSGLGDDEFFLWGHDNTDITTIETGDVPGAVDARLSRAWRVSEVNAAGTSVDVGSVTITWDLNGMGAVTTADLRLLVDTDNDGLFSDETAISGASDLGNGLYAFTTVTAIQDNYRFTLGTADNAQTPLTIVSVGFTGPGGVEQANGSSALEWWLKADQEVFEDTGTEPAESGEAVNQWNDQSGFGRNILQTTPGNRPNYVVNALNGQPVVRFTSANQHYLGALTIDAFQNNYSIMMVGYAANSAQDFVSVLFPTDHGILLEARAANALRFLHRNPPGASGGNNHDNGSTRSDTESQVLTFSRGTPAGGTQQFWINGGDNLGITGSGANFTSAGELSLGYLATASSRFLNGDLAEVIILSKEINEAERIIMENYLAAKYGITLSANEVYAQDDPANGNYDFEVAGIGRVDGSNIHDRAQGSGKLQFFNPTGLGDNEFFMWGHDNGVEQAIPTTDVPGGVEGRFHRVWRVSESDNTGSPVDIGTIDLAWEITDVGSITTADLCLLIDTDNDGLFNDETPVTGAISTGNNIYQFTNISQFTDGVRFTLGTLLSARTPLSSIGTDPKGPAGIGSTDGSSNLEFWYDANDLDGDGDFEDNPADGSAVTTWTDKSGNGRNASTPASTDDPVFLASASNNLPGIDFSSTNDKLEITGFPSLLDANFYIVFEHQTQTAGGSTLRSLLTDDGSTNDWSVHSTSGTTNSVTFIYQNFFFTSSETATLTKDGNAHLLSFGGGFGLAQGYVDNTPGALYSLFPGSAATTYYIGGDPGNADQEYQGYIAELFGFSEESNSAERIILSNYLSAKYNITLGTADIYTMDDNGNGDHDFEVAGIGRVDASNIHDDAQGTGLVRILNPSGLGDDEFLIWGHDNGAPTAVELVDINTAEGVEGRLERVWRVSEVNSSGTPVDVGSLSIWWDLSALVSVSEEDLVLLIDTDNDGAFADETPIEGAANLGTGYYQFPNVTGIEDGTRFTLATSNIINTPLPVTLLNFSAEVQKEQVVKLQWQTATETNNERFTVERSRPGEPWQTILQIPGAGNSNNVRSYQVMDNAPLSGQSYYRLKQTDFDGHYSYSDEVRVQLTLNNRLQIYPNPATNLVTIVGTPEYIADLAVVNILGQDLTSLVSIRTVEETQLLLDLRPLPSGIYLIQSGTDSYQLIKE